MTTETKETKRKNPDYTASAVDLKNPVETLDGLRKVLTVRDYLARLQQEAQECIPKELADKISEATLGLATAEDELKKNIDAFGSYQDTELGMYALKQRKVSVSYDALAFECRYPQYAPAIVIKAVDTTKLKGLIKGGLLDEADMKAGMVSKESESFAYIIK